MYHPSSTVYLFAITFCASVELSSSDSHVIKRSLLYPQYTILQFTYGVSAPLVLPKRNINLSLCAQVNYELPYNTTQLFPMVISARSSSNSRDISVNYDLDRKTFYRYVTAVLDSFNLDGKNCLLRSICEVAEVPMHVEETDSLLEEIVHYLLTPSEDFVMQNISNSSSNDEFLLAEMSGRSGDRCYERFSSCQVSLVDTFTKLFRLG